MGGEFEQRCDVGAIIEGSVVDFVAIDGMSDAVAVEMRRDDDILFGFAGQGGDEVVGDSVACECLSFDP